MWKTDNLVCPDRQDCLSSTSREDAARVLGRCRRHDGARRQRRQRHDERRALPEAVALRADLALMQIDDVPRDRQSETEAGSLRVALGLTQALEHVREK